MEGGQRLLFLDETAGGFHLLIVYVCDSGAF